MTRRSRWFIFGLVCLLSVLLTVGFALEVRRRAAAAGMGGDVDSAANAAALAEARTRPHVLFRSTDVGPIHGRVAIVPLDTAGASPLVAPLRCERLHVVADAGVCLSADRGVFTTYQALVFDSQFNVRHTMPLAGVPSRVRVSPDGRLAAVTVFVTGHSYAGGNFSTQTTLLETATGRVFGDLESFEVRRNGTPFKAVDFNFWGVTFAPDSNRFYATLGTGDSRFLVEGDAKRRTAKVVHDEVECPSLSPDGHRIAFKKRTVDRGRLIWRLAVLDLPTMSERVLTAEQRSVDDQVEWADTARIMYAVPDDPVVGARTSVWVLDVDRDAATLAIPDAVSPTVSAPSPLHIAAPTQP